jgi:hypothetical protein
MDLAGKLIIIWSIAAVAWLALFGPLCVYLGARLVRHRGLSYPRSAAMNGLFALGAGLVELAWGLLLDAVGAPGIAVLVSSLVLAFAVGALVVKWLARVRPVEALKIFGAAFALMLAVHAVVVAVLGIDEELRPEVAAALEVAADPDPEGNMFYALMGFSRSPGKEAHRVGRELVDSFNREMAAPGIHAALVVREEEPLALARYDELEKILERAPGIREFEPRDIEIVEAVFQANLGVVEAYRGLRRFTHFENTVTPNLAAALPSYLSLMSIDSLVLAKAKADFMAGDASAALEALAGEIAFWRFLLGESETLIGKMVAVAVVTRCYRAYAELLDDAAFVASGKLLGDELTNLTEAEYGLAEAMRWEFRAMAASLGEIDDEGFALATGDQPPVPDLGFGLIWKENAALNMIHPWYERMSRDFRLPAHEYVELEAPAKSAIEHGWYEVATNPIAVILTQIAVPAFENYYLRTFEIEGLIRLVRLKQRIREEGISPENIPGFVAGVGDDLKNPYSLQPMVWNPKKKTLSFERVPGEDTWRGEVEIPGLSRIQRPPEEPDAGAGEVSPPRPTSSTSA